MHRVALSNWVSLLIHFIYILSLTSIFVFMIPRNTSPVFEFFAYMQFAIYLSIRIFVQMYHIHALFLFSLNSFFLNLQLELFPIYCLVIPKFSSFLFHYAFLLRYITHAIEEGVK